MKHFRMRDLNFRLTRNSVSIENTSRTTGSTTLPLAYSYQVATGDDLMVKIAEQVMEGFALASEPNAFMVDNFPFCKLVFLSTLSGKLTDGQ